MGGRVYKEGDGMREIRAEKSEKQRTRRDKEIGKKCITSESLTVLTKHQASCKNNAERISTSVENTLLILPGKQP